MRPPVYNCRITKATGQNEAVEITFAAGDADMMQALLDRAGDVLARRTAMHNTQVVQQGEEIRRQVMAAADEIREKQLAELRATGRLVDDPAAGHAMPPDCMRCGYQGGSTIQHECPALREEHLAESPAGPADVRPDS